MKKHMGWIGTVALVCVILMGLGNVMKHAGGNKKMVGVEAYVQARYPGEQFTFSGAQVGGRGAYVIVRMANEPGATFRVFENRGKGKEEFEDTFYTLTLRSEAAQEASRLVKSVFPSAHVIPKIYQLIEGQELPPYPTMKQYYAMKGANIDLRIVVDDSEAALFTQENFDKALKALSGSFYSESVVFSLAKPGEMANVKAMRFADAEAEEKNWASQNVKARINEDGTFKMR